MKLTLLFLSTIFIHLPSWGFTTLGVLKGKNLIRTKAIENEVIRVKYTGEVYRKFFTDVPGHNNYELTQISERELVELAARTAILAWIEPLREISPVELARDIVLVDSDPDITIHFNDKNKSSFFNPIKGKIVLNGKFTGHHSYKTLLHEIGHAFGLGDIDVGVGFKTSNATPGPAVMRIPNGRNTELQQDDINGVRYHYCMISKNCSKEDYQTYTMAEHLDTLFWKEIDLFIQNVFTGDISIDLYEYFFESPGGPLRYALKNHPTEQLHHIFRKPECSTVTDECSSAVHNELQLLKNSSSDLR